MSWIDVRTLGRGGDEQKDSFIQGTIQPYPSWLPEALLILFQPSSLPRTCSATTIKLPVSHSALWSPPSLHLDSTTVSSQQQRAEPSIRLSLTDITHLITGKLKENMQRGYCLSFFFKSQTWTNCLTLHQTCLNRPVSLEEKDWCKIGKA